MDNNDYLHMEEYERHAQGLMSTEELFSFEKRLSQDAKFKKGYEDYLDMQQFLEVKEEITEGKISIEEARKENTSPNAKNTFSLNKLYLIAAAILLLIAAIFFIKEKESPSTQKLYADYFTSPSISLTTKGPQQEMAKEKMIQILKDYYNLKKYEEAYNRLDTTQLSQRDKIDVTIAKGFSALITDREQEGIDLLLPLIEESTNLSDEVYWILGMDQIRKGNVDRGIEYLNKLSSDSNNREKADDVISKLGQD